MRERGKGVKDNMCHVPPSLPLYLYLPISIYLIFLACLSERPSTDDPGECWKRASLHGSSGNTHTSCRRIFLGWHGLHHDCQSLQIAASHTPSPHPSEQATFPLKNHQWLLTAQNPIWKPLTDIQQTKHWPSLYFELKLL